MDIFFDTLLSDQGAFPIYQELRSVDGIASTEFITKDRAAEIFSELYGEDVIEIFGTNILPAGARNYRT